MEKSRFIESYVAAFLAARAVVQYNAGLGWAWVDHQPVNDARELAEAAWQSLQKSVTPSTDATTGSVATATTETGSTHIT